MTAPLQIVFMGTPEFAVPSLAALVAAGYQIAAVYTRADKPAGRGRQPVPSPVKQLALQAGIPVEQPRTLRGDDAARRLASYAPDLLVVAAYGLILPASILRAPRFGPINVHPSLLPRHRGPAPIAGALLAGDEVTGACIMLMDEGIDTGPILSCIVEPIRPDDTTGTLTDRLAAIGARHLIDTIPRWVAGEIQPAPQDDRVATLTRQFQKSDGRLDWSLPAATLAQRIRALQPWPGAFTTWNGRLLKIYRANVITPSATGPPGLPPGTITRLQPEAATGPIAVATGEGYLGIEELQLEGKRRLAAVEFRRGQPPLDGTLLE